MSHISNAVIYLLCAVLPAFASAGTPVDITPDYDVVIRNAHVLDGAGNPAINADIAIKDGRFAVVGRVTGTGTREIDASGLYVSPGWIDMMDQSGGVLLENGRADNKIRMGVTTLIAGEDGTPVPATEIKNYFTQLEMQGISVNFGTYYSATQARVAVIGDSAIDPTPQQLEEMKSLVAHAMEAGAFGITTALIYPPSSYQKTENLIELAKVVAHYGGLYATHLRDEGSGLVAAVEEAIRIGEQSGASVEIFHFKAAHQPGWGTLMHEAIRTIDAARARGVDVAADQYPYIAGGTGLEVSVPNWVFAEGYDAGMKQLAIPKVRDRLKRELEAGSLPGWSNLVHSSGGWENVVLVNSQSDEYKNFHNRNLAEIAKELGKDPADVAWDIVLAAAPKRSMALFFMMSESDIELAMRQPWVSIGSDAAATAKPGGEDALSLPHPRSYGTFPRIIAEYTRKRGVLTLPDAIRKMTSWPASRMGITDRGIIREGLAADVTVFDYEKIAEGASWDKPTEFPTGIEYVLVNGEIVLDEGVHTGARPGTVIMGPGKNRKQIQ